MQQPSKFSYCGPPGFRIKHFTGGVKIHNVISWFENTGIEYVHRGRTAIRHACKLLGLCSGNEVLAPAYNCGSEIDALMNSGTSVVLYRVDRSCKIDLRDLSTRITKRTKVIYITHYFGFPQEVDEIKRICQQNKLYLVEDCALSLFSGNAVGKLGTKGDVAIFSFLKTLPVPDGGALVVNNPELELRSWKRKKPRFSILLGNVTPLFRFAFLRWLSENGLFYPLWRKVRIRNREISIHSNQAGVEQLPEMPKDYYFVEQMSDKLMSTLTERLLKTFDAQEIVRRRCTNFSLFLDVFSRCNNIEPIFKKLETGVCPLYFPIVVDNRDKLCKKLNAKFIGAIPWWAGYHKSLSWNRFSDSCFLKDHVLALPIHQELNQDDIMFIADNLIALNK
jgi:perosamine synthetase